MPDARILIVDDEVAILKALRRGLSMAGHQVEVAPTAGMALELCNEHTFDVVVLDYVMPTMKGIELLMRIRKRQPLIRSILISGQLDESVDERWLTADLKEKVEVDVYLHKPVSNDRLKEEIHELLEVTGPTNWKGIAERTIKARKGKLIQAKAAMKKLDQMKKQ